VGADLRPLWLGAFVVSVAGATMAGALALHWGRILDEEEAVKPPR
jgi:ABC-type branched-subunit amino acid transport system permease subunit